MSERDFWLTIARALKMIVAAIEKRYRETDPLSALGTERPWSRPFGR